jgi:predicted nucleic-acid-binding Zn-ribbon protein
MINGHEVISGCPHYTFCAHVLYTGSCMKECFKRHSKEDSSGTNKAKWKHRAAHNDFLWCECSNCGFRVEAYKAVVSEGRDTNYVDVKYKFCPICGKEMRV